MQKNARISEFQILSKKYETGERSHAATRTGS